MCTHWALARKTDFELFACLIFRSAATKRCFPLPLFFYRTTSENTEIPSTTTKCVAFNCQSPFFRKFRWILNLVRLSRRNWPYTYDVAFCYSALLQRISSFFYRLGNVSLGVLWKTFIFDDHLADMRWYQATRAWSLDSIALAGFVDQASDSLDHV